MKLAFIIPALLMHLATHAQTFFVSGSDPKSVTTVNQKIKYEGYQLSDSADADYIVNLLIDGHYKAVTVFNLSYHGYILIRDRNTNVEICRTSEAQANPAVLNNYNASITIFNKISKKYLPDALKKCPKKDIATK